MAAIYTAPGDGQSHEDIVRVWFPEAKLMLHPCGGVFIAWPCVGGLRWAGRKVFSPGTPDVELWEDAYQSLVERCRATLQQEDRVVK